MGNGYQEQIDDLLKRPVSRAEFLKYIGVALLGMMGITNFLKSLHRNVGSGTGSITKKSSGGFGAGPYGR